MRAPEDLILRIRKGSSRKADLGGLNLYDRLNDGLISNDDLVLLIRRVLFLFSIKPLVTADGRRDHQAALGIRRAADLVRKEHDRVGDQRLRARLAKAAATLDAVAAKLDWFGEGSSLKERPGPKPSGIDRAVILIGIAYKKRCGTRPTVTTDRVSGSLGGDFLNFADAILEKAIAGFDAPAGLPDTADARRSAIQKALYPRD